MYNSLKVKTNENCFKTCAYAIGACTGIYIIVGLLGIFFFGMVIEKSILANIADEGKIWESITLRIIFLLVLACHIPFIFFTGKESILAIVDETQRKSISDHLNTKFREYLIKDNENDAI